jgi:hypothetical protein
VRIEVLVEHKNLKIREKCAKEEICFFDGIVFSPIGPLGSRRSENWDKINTPYQI